MLPIQNVQVTLNDVTLSSWIIYEWGTSTRPLKGFWREDVNIDIQQNLFIIENLSCKDGVYV